MRGKISSLAAVLVLGTALTACTGDTEEPTAKGSERPASSQTIKSTSASFGESPEDKCGVSVVVSQPYTFTPSKNAIAGGEPEFVTFQVTLENNSNAAVAPSQLSLSVESAEQQGGEVLDRKKGIDGPPQKRVRPGGEITWDVAFGVVDPTDVIVQAQLGLEATPLVFSAAG